MEMRDSRRRAAVVVHFFDFFLRHAQFFLNTLTACRCAVSFALQRRGFAKLQNGLFGSMRGVRPSLSVGDARSWWPYVMTGKRRLIAICAE
jgi:hypothetical protein